ncbi:hypothetical protein GCM10020367_27250 [Streptomyces sannanensis]|uniref:Uncharacterized protein n=1 Tax=Streptomyces sannanensis TaxID=285536 RepID=A0ABP6SBF9_9ACTN
MAATKKELHDLVERLRPDRVDDVADVLRRAAAPSEEPPTHVPTDTRLNADAELLDGFGR